MTEAEGDIPGALTGLLFQLAEVPRERLPAEYLEPLRPGTALGRFQVERELGRGGFGTVYAALDTALGRRVALKVLHPGAGSGPDHPERLRQEAEAVARLQHPALVTLFDVGQSEHGAYLVFELLAGETLAARLRRGPLPRAEVLRIGLAVAEALAHAHAAGVLHLDLKPANVFLCADGAVKVLDFGMARLFGQPSSASGGTPGYMAPEQAEPRGGDQRSDLFSLGVLLHELGGGQVPRGQASGVDLSGGTGARALRALVADLTRADPEARPAGMEPVVARLRFMRGARRRAALAAGAVLALAALGGAGVLLWRRDGPPRPVERLQLVLASGGNSSGRPELDHLPALVRIGLEDSRRVGIVVGAAGAQGRLLVGSAGSGEALRVSLRAELPVGTVKFEREVTVASLQEIPRALDGLLRELRLGLGDPAAEVAAAKPVAQLATPSLPAFAAFAAGLDCEGEAVVVAPESLLYRCARQYQEALTQDPSFALAHYHLGLLLEAKPHAAEEVKSHLAAAMAGRSRLSLRDGALVEAWGNRLGGRPEVALRRYASLLAASPDDVAVLRLAGQLAFDQGRYADAAPYLARMLALDPQAAWARDLLVTSHALVGADVELRALGERLAAAPDWPSQRAAIHAFAWLGEHERGIQLAKAASAASPRDDERLLMVVAAYTAAGRFAEAEPAVERIVADHPAHVLGFINRICLARSQGMVRRAWTLLDRPSPASQALAPAEVAYLKSLLAAGDGDLHRMLLEARKVDAAAPELAWDLFVLAELIGQTPGNEVSQAQPPADSTTAAELKALRAWKQGKASEAVAALLAVERRDPWPVGAVAPAYLLAEVALASDPAEALSAAARYRRQWPRGLWGSWAYPRSLLISASAALRLGDHGAALAHLDRLDAMLANGDADLPLRHEAQALRRQLADPASGR